MAPLVGVIMGSDSDLPVMKSWVPVDSAAEQMGLRRAPLTSYASSGRAVNAYLKMWREIGRILKK